MEAVWPFQNIIALPLYGSPSQKVPEAILNLSPGICKSGHKEEPEKKQQQWSQHKVPYRRRLDILICCYFLGYYGICIFICMVEDALHCLRRILNSQNCGTIHTFTFQNFLFTVFFLRCLTSQPFLRRFFLRSLLNRRFSLFSLNNKILILFS